MDSKKEHKSIDHSHHANYKQNVINEEHKEILSENLQDYAQFFKTVLSQDWLSQYRQRLSDNKIFYSNVSSQPRPSIIVTDSSQKKMALILNVSISNFSFEINILNLHEKSKLQPLSEEYDSVITKLGQGGEGSVYRIELPDMRQFAIKSIQYYSNKNSSQNKIQRKNLANVIYEYCFYKLFSALQIGPLVTMQFGFDIIIYKDAAEFTLEICEPMKNERNDILKTSLQMIHSLNIIHGDIKDTNIMWSPTFNKNVFIDFGFSIHLREKIGQKTFTQYFGTYRFCSKQMQKLFSESSFGRIDLYYNDVIGLQTVFEYKDGQNECIMKHENIKIVKLSELGRKMKNQALNVKLAFIIFKGDFSLLEDLSRNFKAIDIEDTFYALAKQLRLSNTSGSMLYSIFQRYGNSESQRNIRQIIWKSAYVDRKEPQTRDNFDSRVAEVIQCFDGAITDIMFFIFIIFRQDCTPKVKIESYELEKKIMQLDVKNRQFWQSIVHFSQNVYVTDERLSLVFQKVYQKLEINEQKGSNYPQLKLYSKAYTIAMVGLTKYKVNMFQFTRLKDPNYLQKRKKIIASYCGQKQRLLKLILGNLDKIDERSYLLETIKVFLQGKEGLQNEKFILLCQQFYENSKAYKKHLFSDAFKIGHIFQPFLRTMFVNIHYLVENIKCFTASDKIKISLLNTSKIGRNAQNCFFLQFNIEAYFFNEVLFHIFMKDEKCLREACAKFIQISQLYCSLIGQSTRFQSLPNPICRHLEYVQNLIIDKFQDLACLESEQPFLAKMYEGIINQFRKDKNNLVKLFQVLLQILPFTAGKEMFFKLVFVSMTEIENKLELLHRTQQEMMEMYLKKKKKDHELALMGKLSLINAKNQEQFIENALKRDYSKQLDYEYFFQLFFISLENQLDVQKQYMEALRVTFSKSQEEWSNFILWNHGLFFIFGSLYDYEREGDEWFAVVVDILSRGRDLERQRDLLSTIKCYLMPLFYKYYQIYLDESVIIKLFKSKFSQGKQAFCKTFGNTIIIIEQILYTSHRQAKSMGKFYQFYGELVRIGLALRSYSNLFFQRSFDYVLMIASTTNILFSNEETQNASVKICLQKYRYTHSPSFLNDDRQVFKLQLLYLIFDKFDKFYTKTHRLHKLNRELVFYRLSQIYNVNRKQIFDYVVPFRIKQLLYYFQAMKVKQKKYPGIFDFFIELPVRVIE